MIDFGCNAEFHWSLERVPKSYIFFIRIQHVIDNEVQERAQDGWERTGEALLLAERTHEEKVRVNRFGLI